MSEPRQASIDVDIGEGSVSQQCFDGEYAELSDEALTQIAEALFVALDKEECAHEG